MSVLEPLYRTGYIVAVRTGWCGHTRRIYRNVDLDGRGQSSRERGYQIRSSHRRTNLQADPGVY